MRFLLIIVAVALAAGCGVEPAAIPEKLLPLPVFVTGPRLTRAEEAMALREAEEKTRVEKGWYDQVPSP
jgi:hypothetical protein